MTQSNGSEATAECLNALTPRRHQQKREQSSAASISRAVNTAPIPAQRADYEQRAAAEERAKLEHDRHSLWSASGVPKCHRDRCVTDNNEAWSDKLATLQSMTGSGMLVALLGDRGVGKTQLAVELCRYVCAELKAASYVRTMDFFMAVQACYRDSGSAEANVIRKFCQPSLLVLDEAHERGNSEWEDRMLTHLIDKRYGDGRDTVLVSNQTESEFKACQCLQPTV